MYYSLTTCTIINTVDSTCTITKNGLHSCKDTIYQTKKKSAGYLLIAGVFLKIIIWTHFKKLVNSNICSLPSRLVAITSINLCCMLIITSKLKHFHLSIAFYQLNTFSILHKYKPNKRYFNQKQQHWRNVNKNLVYLI